MDERLERFFRIRLRNAGRQYERARTAFNDGKSGVDAADGDLPTDDAGRAKLVCRRYAEKRAVELDDEGRPACFDGDHTDCVGCVEDIQAGRIETW
jgi:hypothetical protein